MSPAARCPWYGRLLRIELFERGVGFFEFGNPFLHRERFRRSAAREATLGGLHTRQQTVDVLADGAQNLAHPILELQLHENRFDLLADTLADFGHVPGRVAEPLHEIAEMFQHRADRRLRSGHHGLVAA
jgi:hypothetical protein